jgi:hypothetical protein
MDELVISLRKSRKGHPTPWLDASRERFKKAAAEAGKELRDTELRGAARVIAFNEKVREKLTQEGKYV